MLSTIELRAQLDQGRFYDKQWVEAYLVNFANLYRAALAAYERQDLARVPSAWRLSFDGCASGNRLLMQDLLLGINAHVNYDLAFALSGAGLQKQRESRWQDHIQVNDALREATGRVQARLAAKYGWGLRYLDQAFGSLDEKLTAAMFEYFRGRAWSVAVEYADATTDVDRLALAAAIDRRATTISDLILWPSRVDPAGIALLQFAEQGRLDVFGSAVKQTPTATVVGF